MKTPPIVSRQEWEAARQQLLVKEKELTRACDALAAERRRMPWLAVEKKYEFDGPEGRASLLDLFDGRRQLIVYRAFFEPGVSDWPDHACIGCSMVADQVAHPAPVIARDTTLAVVWRAPRVVGRAASRCQRSLAGSYSCTSPLGGQPVTGAGQLLLLHEQLLARSLPLLPRDDRGCLH